MRWTRRRNAVLALLLTVGLAPTVAPGLAPAAAHGAGSCGMYAIAHRGDHTNYDENTISAVTAVPHAETDLRVTRDGRFILMHDARVNRTTNGDGYVANRTWRYIRSLRTGPIGGRVPSWSDTLTAIKKSGTVLTVEVKSYGSTWTEDQLAAAVQQVRDMGLRRQVYLGGYSGAHPALMRVAGDMRLYWRPERRDRVNATTIANHDAAAVLLLPRRLSVRLVNRAQRASAIVWARRSKQPRELTRDQYWAQIAKSGARGLYTDTPYAFDRWCR